MHTLYVRTLKTRKGKKFSQVHTAISHPSAPPLSDNGVLLFLLSG